MRLRLETVSFVSGRDATSVANTRTGKVSSELMLRIFVRSKVLLLRTECSICHAMLKCALPERCLCLHWSLFEDAYCGEDLLCLDSGCMRCDEGSAQTSSHSIWVSGSHSSYFHTEQFWSV
jgi:hypothetical protein